MAVLKSKPTSPGRRHAVRVVSQDLHKGAPHGPLLEKQSRKGALHKIIGACSRLITFTFPPFQMPNARPI